MHTLIIDKNTDTVGIAPTTSVVEHRHFYATRTAAAVISVFMFVVGIQQLVFFLTDTPINPALLILEIGILMTLALAVLLKHDWTNTVDRRDTGLIRADVEPILDTLMFDVSTDKIEAYTIVEATGFTRHLSDILTSSDSREDKMARMNALEIRA